jgi:hypothetical protein
MRIKPFNARIAALKAMQEVIIAEIKAYMGWVSHNFKQQQIQMLWRIDLRPIDLSFIDCGSNAFYIFSA